MVMRVLHGILISARNNFLNLNKTAQWMTTLGGLRRGYRESVQTKEMIDARRLRIELESNHEPCALIIA